MKIGTLTPIWNQELFIKPHFELLKKLDRNVVLMQSGPLPNYRKEHGYSKTPDLSRYVLEMYFPHVEIYESEFPTHLDFCAELYNEGLQMMQDCDVVLRLDPDMLFSESDFDKFIDFIRNNKHDAYQMDFRTDSINYYVTGDYDHGLKDAQEDDALAVNPNIMFTGVLDYEAENKKVIDIDGWMCHHFRGWNKPKSTPLTWATHMVGKEYIETYWDKKNKDWYHCPKDIKTTMINWLKELEQIKIDIKQ